MDLQVEPLAIVKKPFHCHGSGIDFSDKVGKLCFPFVFIETQGPINLEVFSSEFKDEVGQ